MLYNYKLIVFFILISCAFTLNAQLNFSGITLSKTANTTQLLINKKPFIVLGGELGNSTASNFENLKPHLEALKKRNLNTVLTPVYWELIEPQENKFDFSLLDKTILEARKNNLKLVLLWFGTWKNSMSCYAPSWMKKNEKRFPRTLDSSNRSHEIFSVFGKNTLEADKKAFAALLKHIKAIDQKHQTVIMVQVENEIAFLTTAREYSKIANAKFDEPIPIELSNFLKNNSSKLVPELREKLDKNGNKLYSNWSTTFGLDIYTDEIFQAWYYAKYTNEVALAGKNEYNIPMFVNAALPRPGKLPGQYPTAGPLPHLMNLWQIAAPSIDLLCPDFYNPNFKKWCDLYVRNENVLFIPEIQFDKTCAAKVFYAIGHYKAIGFSPFAIEDSNNLANLPLQKSYAVLNQILPKIAETKFQNMDGFLLDKNEKSTSASIGKYNINVAHYNTMSWASEAKDSIWTSTGGLILQIAEDEFLVAGTGVVFVFENTNNKFVTNIERVDEVTYLNGKEILGRRMNGDENHQGRHLRFPIGEWGIQKVKLYNSNSNID